MLQVQIDPLFAETILREEIQKNIEQVSIKTLFWDMKELCRQVQMSETFVKEQFFYNPDFPKFRVGKKWLMPAKQTEEFLLAWIAQQPRN
ncbi:group-specific protein [Enterococcus faecalis]|uniref:group-specific protein n=1 Tax=Enterococcus faecalis TaxID=1351 RepID=UPI002FDC73CA